MDLPAPAPHYLGSPVSASAVRAVLRRRFCATDHPEHGFHYHTPRAAPAQVLFHTPDSPVTPSVSPLLPTTPGFCIYRTPG